MSDRIFAFVAMLGFVVFVGIVAVGVMEPDLWIVAVVVVAIAIFDFWRTFREASPSRPEAGEPSEAEAVVRRHST